MNKDLEEKRKSLKLWQENRSKLHEIIQQNKKGLSEAFPYDLAVELHENGGMSDQVFSEYKDAYDSLIINMQMLPSTLAGIDKTIDELKEEIKLAEQEERKNKLGEASTQPDNISSEPENENPHTEVVLIQTKSKNPPPGNLQVCSLEATPIKRRFFVLAAVLALTCVLLAASSCFFWNQVNSMRREAEALEEKNAELQKTIQILRRSNKSAQEKITKLVEEKTELSNRLDLLDGRLYEMFDPYYFLQNNIGFIVDGSNRYHNYSCSIFQEADEYWAHNIEYCEYLGYYKCLKCWG